VTASSLVPSSHDVLARVEAHRTAGQLEEAAALCQQVLAETPSCAPAWRALAGIARQVGNQDAVLGLLRRAATLCPDDAAIANDLGVAFFDRGDLAAAADCYRRAVALDPADPAAWCNVAIASARQGDSQGAIEAWEAALLCEPDFVAAHYNLGNIRKDLGQREPAVEAYRRAVTLDPAHAEAWNNLGVVLTELERLDEAADACDRAIALRPELAVAHYNLGNVRKAQDDIAAATACFEQAIERDPTYAQAHNNLGVALGEAGRHAECIAACRRALELEPGYARAWYNIGNAHRALGSLEEAVESYRAALALDDAHHQTLNNLGIVLSELGRPEEAMQAWRAALALQPDDPELHMSVGLGLLLTGRFDEGWTEFEWRLRTRRYAPRLFPRPLWDGASMPDGSILLHAEGGFGDTVQFVRYASWVRRHCRRVLVLCQPALADLIASASGVDEAFGDAEALPPFDAHAPMLALPRLHGTQPGTIPADIPYLFAEPDRVARFSARPEFQSGPRVGIAWQGNPRHVGDKLRSIPLTCFEPLARVGSARLFSLQRGPGSEQLLALAGRFPVTDLGPDIADARDLAAAICALDLVIACDTMIAHLAGAVGVPVWCAISTAPDWRWRNRGETTAWYRSMRLYRQSRPRDWPTVFARMTADLRGFAPA
jgi:tetratricopeptide (TPR) repeat protein